MTINMLIPSSLGFVISSGINNWPYGVD
jgi:hypothetical protein